MYNIATTGASVGYSSLDLTPEQLELGQSIVSGLYAQEGHKVDSVHMKRLLYGDEEVDANALRVGIPVIRSLTIKGVVDVVHEPNPSHQRNRSFRLNLENLFGDDELRQMFAPNIHPVDGT
jgi:hypothetical protein